MWRTGSGDAISFEEIAELIKKHSELNGRVYVGSDSFLHKKQCTFSTAICLTESDKQTGGRYFIKKTKFKASEYKHLVGRITAEVEKSIDVGMKILNHCPQVKIELHLDVSESSKNHKTSKMSEMLVGYAKGSGFECKVKPQAFAASSVADRHSK
jgi:predicted RNase H-related nuclease YkuK (DUF458 family)